MTQPKKNDVKPKSVAKLSTQQQSHLMDRIAHKYRALEMTAWSADEDGPKEVREARARIARFEQERERTRDARIEALKKDKALVREKVLFSTPEEALAAVKKYEAS